MAAGVDRLRPDAPTVLHPSDYPVEEWLHFLGHRWSAVLLWRLAGETLRYTELAERLPGISPKVLTERLSGMVKYGLVIRTAGTGFPRQADYRLSDRGLAVMLILDGFRPLGRLREPVASGPTDPSWGVSDASSP
ncbi:helix-turn-helix domain-containing protein [Caulobacter sp. BP25]|uniref:winged helix-turn-helix transcriptional regulator n=1 Tax=Caulobacter sp. BP25 TaxID=2048900 RepID=UPI0013747526|nr:helix-turn-helix domain-containing protein [Caulobacter sp. BP25]